MKFLLDAHKIQHSSVDISTAEADKEYLQKVCKEAGKPHIPPLLFKDGACVCNADELDEANEFGELQGLLGIAK